MRRGSVVAKAQQAQLSSKTVQIVDKLFEIFNPKVVLDFEKNSLELNEFVHCSGQRNALSFHSGKRDFCLNHTFPEDVI